ncbi:hypothetical protein FOXYSP1_05646 [Fusarium oxysporum f. sp. phaseoli]
MVHLNAPIICGLRAPWTSKYATDSAPQLPQSPWAHEQASARWVVQLGHLCHTAIGCWQRHRVKQLHIRNNSHNGTTANDLRQTVPSCSSLLDIVRLTIAPTASQNRYQIRQATW